MAGTQHHHSQDNAFQPLDYKYYDAGFLHPDPHYGRVYPHEAGNASRFRANGSSDVEYYYYEDSGAVLKDGYHYVEPSILVLICLVGLLGNGLVVVVIVRQVTMRKVTYLYLTNLALVNIFYLLTTVPFSAISYAITHWPFGAAACKLHGYVTSVCLSVSVFTLMITGLDRYLAVLHPVTSRKWRTEGKAMVVIAVVWLLSFLIMIPRLFLYDLQELFGTAPYTLCSRLSASMWARRADSTAMLVTMYILPQLVLSFCHLKIGVLLWQSRRPGAESHEVSLLALRERRRVAKVVFAITLAFGVGWLPLHVTKMFEDFSDRGLSFFFGNRAVLVLAFSFGANAINPILYCLLSKHFRKHFRRAVVCCKMDTHNAVHHVTPVLDLQHQNEDIVVIDLDNAVDENHDTKYGDDISMNGEDDTAADGSTLADMKTIQGEDEENSCSLNCYVHTESPYCQMPPDSRQDSGHGIGDGQKRREGKNRPVFRKATVVSAACEPRCPAPQDV